MKPKTHPARPKKSKGMTPPTDPTEIQRLVHELQVHQVELETQNEELRQAQQLLEESRNRYADLYDSSPIGYATLDTHGTIQEINLTGARMLGIPHIRLIGLPLGLHIAKAEIEKFHTFIAKSRQSTDTTTIDLTL